METLNIEQKFRKYFEPHELVSALHYKEFKDKLEVYDLFSDKLKAVIVYLRESIGLSFTVNTWHKQGQFQYRGYRDKTCSIGAHHSLHKTGEALDFDIRGFEAEQGRKLIVEKIGNLPYPIRIENSVNWIHLDVAKFEGTHKIKFFNAK